MKLLKALTGHEGWIYSVCVDPSNEWFATASSDTTIKVWSLAGKLKLTLTGHRLPVRSVEVSNQLAYMFSGSEDKAVFCWDLETNSVCRRFHGHASGVYTVETHPTIPFLLFSGSRDKTVRVWDVRSRHAVHVLPQTDSVSSLLAQPYDPQLISGSVDGNVMLWDLIAGKAMKTLTYHTRAVQSLAASAVDYTFMSGAECINEYSLPSGDLLGQFGQFGAVDTVLSLSVRNNEVFAGYDSGKLICYDYTTGETLEELKYRKLDSEASVLTSSVDKTSTRLVTGHRDKAVRIWSLAD